MKFNFLRPGPEAAEAGSGGVYASLDQLTRLQAQATGFSFLPRQPVRSLLAGRHASRLRGRGLSFDEIRHYLPGDDIRSMDWKVTARTRKPHVRIYTEERDRPVYLVVDQRQSMFFGSRRCMKSVAAAEAAALAAWRVLDSGDRVGGLLFNDTDINEIPAHGSRQRVMQLLGRLIEMNHQLSADAPGENNPAMLNRVLEHAGRIARHDALIIVITDGAGVDEETVRHASRIIHRNDLVWVRIFDPLEQQLPDIGRVNFAAGESVMPFNTADRRLRKKYRKQFDNQMDWARSQALQAEIPHLPIDTAGEVAGQVRKILGEAGSR
jgi:uncharacterized protein (DUF58 family)